jgi:hypothetical protein
VLNIGLVDPDLNSELLLEESIAQRDLGWRAFEPSQAIRNPRSFCRRFRNATHHVINLRHTLVIITRQFTATSNRGEEAGGLTQPTSTGKYRAQPSKRAYIQKADG